MPLPGQEKKQLNETFCEDFDGVCARNSIKNRMYLILFENLTGNHLRKLCVQGMYKAHCTLLSQILSTKQVKWIWIDSF